MRKITPFKLFLSCIIVFVCVSVNLSAGRGNKELPGPRNDENKVLILEIRGLTYELLERAYAPNIQYLLENGFLTSLEKRERLPQGSTQRRTGTGIRRKLGYMVQCLDSAYQKKTSVYTVGVVSDTITGLFSQRRKNFRSNESMVKDFVSSGNGANIVFSFLSFRSLDRVEGPSERKQMDNITTIDSLIGIIFKSYQEQLKWDKTTVILLSDGLPAHEYSASEKYFNTPVIIKSAGVFRSGNPALTISIDQLLDFVNSKLETNCSSGILSDTFDRTQDIFTDGDDSLDAFIRRPDILVSKFTNNNHIALDIYSDDNETIYFTTNGDDPITKGKMFNKQVVFTEPGVYEIQAVTKHGNDFSVIVNQNIVIRDKIYSIAADPLPSAKYTFDGVDELVDSDTAELDFSADKWLGFQGTDVNFTFDFGVRRQLTSVDLSALQDYMSWIFLPNKVTFFAGNELNNLVELGSVSYETRQHTDTLSRKHFQVNVSENQVNSLGKSFVRKIRGRKYLYVKYLVVKVVANKNAPEWFKLPGAQTWFFIDEIQIK